MTQKELEEFTEWEKIEIRKWCVERILAPILAQLSHSELDREIETEEILTAARELEQFIMKG